MNLSSCYKYIFLLFFIFTLLDCYDSQECTQRGCTDECDDVDCKCLEGFEPSTSNSGEPRCVCNTSKVLDPNGVCRSCDERGCIPGCTNKKCDCKLLFVNIGTEYVCTCNSLNFEDPVGVCTPCASKGCEDGCTKDNCKCLENFIPRVGKKSCSCKSSDFESSIGVCQSCASKGCEDGCTKDNCKCLETFIPGDGKKSCSCKSSDFESSIGVCQSCSSKGCEDGCTKDNCKCLENLNPGEGKKSCPCKSSNFESSIGVCQLCSSKGCLANCTSVTCDCLDGFTMAEGNVSCTCNTPRFEESHGVCKSCASKGCQDSCTKDTCTCLKNFIPDEGEKSCSCDSPNFEDPIGVCQLCGSKGCKENCKSDTCECLDDFTLATGNTSCTCNSPRFQDSQGVCKLCSSKGCRANCTNDKCDCLDDFTLNEDRSSCTCKSPRFEDSQGACKTCISRGCKPGCTKDTCECEENLTPNEDNKNCTCEPPNFENTNGDCKVDPCESKNCSQTCDKYKNTCICKENFKLDADNKTCICEQPNFLQDPQAPIKEQICIAHDACEENTTFSENTQTANEYCAERNAACEGIRHSYVCNCNAKNEYFDDANQTCVEIDMCLLKTCKVSERCIKNNCECLPGFQINVNDTTCKEMTKDEKSEFCQANCGDITDIECSYDLLDLKCKCPGDLFLYNDKKKTCDSIACKNPILNNCKHFCTEEPYHNMSTASKAFTCGCNPDFDLDEKNGNCVLNDTINVDNCTADFCVHGTCISDKGYPECICEKNFQSANCSECVKFKEEDLAVISNLTGIERFCPDCKIAGNQVKCVCEGEYESDGGLFCRKKTRCNVTEIITCGEERNAMCEWRTNSSYCVCEQGYEEDPDGKCKDKCQFYENYIKCTPYGASCKVNEAGNTTCVCDSLYLKWSEPLNGKPSCVFETEIHNLEFPGIKVTRSLESSNNLLYYASPAVDSQVVKKRLTPLLRAAGEGKFEEIKEISCKVPVDDYFSCVLTSSFREKISPSAFLETLNDTISGNGCKKVDGQEDCLLSSGIVLNPVLFSISANTPEVKKACDYKGNELKPCRPEITNSECTALPNNPFAYSCECMEGYRKSIELVGRTNEKEFMPTTCLDIDNCAEGTDLCKKDMSNCVKTKGDYICECKDMYVRNPNEKGKAPKECLDVCDNLVHKCINGTCQPLDQQGNYYCNCTEGKFGTYCDKDVPEIDKPIKPTDTVRAAGVDGNMPVIVTGCVLGAVLLVTLLVAGVSISKLRKQVKKANNQFQGHGNRGMTRD